MSTGLYLDFSYQSDYDHGQSKIAIITSQWHKEITSALQDGAIQALRQYGVQNIFLADVPGSFELIFAANRTAQTNYYDAIICLGCVIKGETDHNTYINQAITQGIAQINLKYHTPCVLGVLTALTIDQALDRTGRKFINKGTEAAIAALQMIEFNKKANLYPFFS